MLEVGKNRTGSADLEREREEGHCGGWLGAFVGKLYGV